MHISLVDYHCHLDLYPNFEELISDCESKRIYTLAVTTTPKAWPKNLALTKNLTYVRPALGLHPQLIEQRESEISLWDEYLPQAKFVGEVGLDAGPNFYKSFEKQIEIFNHIVKQCTYFGSKVLSVHSVRSVTPVLNVFEKYNLLKNNKAVLHWFSGSISDVKKGVEMGCYFSINLQMLTSNRGNEILKAIPPNLILTETDGPFTSINARQQRPEDIQFCVDKISNIWRLPIDETKSIILNNLITIEK